jgi:hypothetical protein
MFVSKMLVSVKGLKGFKIVFNLSYSIYTQPKDYATSATLLESSINFFEKKQLFLNFSTTSLVVGLKYLYIQVFF